MRFHTRVRMDPSVCVHHSDWPARSTKLDRQTARQTAPWQHHNTHPWSEYKWNKMSAAIFDPLFRDMCLSLNDILGQFNHSSLWRRYEFVDKALNFSYFHKPFHIFINFVSDWRLIECSLNLAFLCQLILIKSPKKFFMMCRYVDWHCFLFLICFVLDQQQHHTATHGHIMDEYCL